MRWFKQAGNHKFTWLVPDAIVLLLRKRADLLDKIKDRGDINIYQIWRGITRATPVNNVPELAVFLWIYRRFVLDKINIFIVKSNLENISSEN